MSLQEKGFVISIQHLQSHRGILGHAIVQRDTRPNLAIGEVL